MRDVIRLAAIGGILVAGTAIVSPQSMTQPRHVKANGADLAYVEQGKGAAVVFAHGAVGDLRYWEPQRQQIARRYRFVSYSYRYHGTDPWPDEGQQYAPKTHADDLAAFIRALEAGPVHLVGLSYGGLLAALVALDHPELVRTLTLAEPGLFSLLVETPDGKPALEAWTKASAPMIATLKTGDVLGATKHLAALVTGKGPDSFEQLPAAFRQILQDNARTLPLLFAAPAVAVPCERLKSVKTPTLVVGGAESPMFFGKMNEIAVKCIPGSRLHVVPKASHAMSFDNPAAFNQALLQFLAKH